MKTIEDKYNPFPITKKCVWCTSLIELESKEDLEWKDDSKNEYFWTCPCCDMLNSITIDLD